MNKKQRLEAIKKGEVPDYMPVFPFILTHGVYSCGWTLPDITSHEHLDSEKSAHTVLETLKKYDYDIAFGSYYDLYFGMEALGGVIKIPSTIGSTVSAEKYPVEKPTDWPEVKKKFSTIFEKDKRIKGLMESISIVAQEVGEEVPIATWGMPGATNCTLLIRSVEALAYDMIEEPDFAHEMCDYANRFNIDFIRRQYEAGANSFCLLGDIFGTELISPTMCEEFVLPHVAAIVDIVKKEFNQEVWMHIHGDFKKPNTNPIIDKLVNEVGVKAIHLDQQHDAQWVKENIADKYKIPAAIILHGLDMYKGPEERIDNDIKEMIQKCRPNYCFMAPSCEVPPNIPESHIKTWIEKTHEYSAEFYLRAK